jgi:protein-L-isoaspartate(D-aspartate) O-methyltransferase
MKLIQQMKTGGKMVIPMGSGDIQIMKRITKLESGELQTEVFDQFSFVPMLVGKND